MTPAMDRETKNCPCCNGRGYLRCDCWPGDCICGWGDEDCENCNGDGIVWVDEDEWPTGLADAEGAGMTRRATVTQAAMTRAAKVAAERGWGMVVTPAGEIILAPVEALPLPSQPVAEPTAYDAWKAKREAERAGRS